MLYKNKGGDYMDISAIASIISSVGFPIAACCYMFYLNQKQTEQHKEEIDKLRESLDNNTKVMTRICEKLHIDQ